MSTDDNGKEPNFRGISISNILFGDECFAGMRPSEIDNIVEMMENTYKRVSEQSGKPFHETVSVDEYQRLKNDAEYRKLRGITYHDEPSSLVEIPKEWYNELLTPTLPQGSYMFSYGTNYGDVTINGSGAVIIDDSVVIQPVKKKEKLNDFIRAKMKRR